MEKRFKSMLKKLDDIIWFISTNENSVLFKVKYVLLVKKNSVSFESSAWGKCNYIEFIIMIEMMIEGM